ncbi:DegQ family serine endoprotease [Thermodesulforhabdus norvegica]|uniref:Probable periplasmic serine endoprotease DegP-like n=1 Tax=Thermodesulforhabdus norvegica TaxID=39841 RepID=A0A1I4T8Y6_9BACT|nr:DegQ family serine endoprotease [Thermodesulforhabdus norvegica]SFM73040.1 serine protease Do [Thermodesulforhabdus norvegica]
MKCIKAPGLLGVVLTVVVVLHANLSLALWPSKSASELPSFADLVEKVKHSVVNISTTKVIKDHPLQPFLDPDSPFRDFFGDEFFKRFFGDLPKREFKTHSLGSGFIISSDGYILTNNHVIEKADEITIKLDSGREYEAKIVGRDPKTDLALIKVKPDKDFPDPAVLGDSDELRVGDWVIAVGNPFGLGHTVTAGIISAKGRVIGAGPYDDFLQTDAAINPGNSGGPLFNLKGEVVGINTAIVARGQGIGFAIPINMAKELLPQLKEGKIVRGWLGVMIQDLTPELAKSFGLKEPKGALVADVLEGGPADKAGIKRGDIIVEFDGKEIPDARTLSRIVAATAPNSHVDVTVLRDGKKKHVSVIVGTMPEEGATEFETGDEAVEKAQKWGLTVQNLTPEVAERFGWSRDETGVLVTGVEPGSPAWEARVSEGDLIKEVNRRKVHNIRDFKLAISKAKETESLLLLIKRGDHTLYLALPPLRKAD